ncbi:MAG TPA: phytoene/squalene synthase family protein [Alphaproteobacteria bacterium]|nr:phytoene/squalene synthase family protein [Alphaproteobacteria bacterium]
MAPEPVAEGAGTPPSSSLAERIRKLDPDRYLTALFAPAKFRPSLFALIAFNYEIARIRESVTEPILGQIRLQWWREALEQIYTGTPPAHDVAQALAAAVSDAGLDRGRLERMIDARETDLKAGPLAGIEELLAYAVDSAGTLIELMLQALGEPDATAAEKARSVGTAYALVGLCRAIPFHMRSQRSFIPHPILTEHGLTHEDLFRSSPPRELPAIVAELCGIARLHLLEARENAGSVPRSARPALLSATVADTYLRRLKRAGYDVFHPSVVERPPGLIWRLAARAWTGRW